MVTALMADDVLAARYQEPWLVGPEAATFWAQFAQFQARFQNIQPHDVLVADPHPVRFLAALLAAVQYPCRVWLANPQWGSREWAQVAAQCQPDWTVGRIAEERVGPHSPKIEPGSTASATTLAAPKRVSHQSRILIPTGGSSGNIRFAVHTWATLGAAVQGFREHFDCETVNAYCVLPLYHVSGLMQALRCLLSGGRLVIQPFPALLSKDPAVAPLALSNSCSFLSLVPTQLQRLLVSDRDFRPWLRQFRAILLGGAPPWPSLLQTARDLALPLAPTYGMTETAAQVATLLPQEFWAGKTGSGRALPHAGLTIRDGDGNRLPPDQIGQIAIATTSLAQVSGQTPLTPPFQTGDLGYLDAAGYLHVVGRAQTLIITGGEKVLPAEVEAVILATGLVPDVVVLGIPDADWGEQVVAVIASDDPTVSDRLSAALKSQLSPYKRPKQWFCQPELLRNAQGKLNRAALCRWVMTQLRSTPAANE